MKRNISVYIFEHVQTFKVNILLHVYSSVVLLLSQSVISTPVTRPTRDKTTFRAKTEVFVSVFPFLSPETRF